MNEDAQPLRDFHRETRERSGALAEQLRGYEFPLPSLPKVSPAAEIWGKPERERSCYRARAGFTVHVRPGCRCPR